MLHTKRLTQSTVCDECGRPQQAGDIAYLNNNNKTFCSKECLTSIKHSKENS